MTDETPVFDRMEDAHDAATGSASVIPVIVKTEEVPNRWIPSRTLRAYLYTIILAAGPIVTFYGIATAEEVALWIGLGGTILATPASTLALGNLPTTPKG